MKSWWRRLNETSDRFKLHHRALDKPALQAWTPDKDIGLEEQVFNNDRIQQYARVDSRGHLNKNYWIENGVFVGSAIHPVFQQ
jgi:hypothetical protein